MKYLSGREAYDLLKKANAVFINHAASNHLVESHSGEFTLDGATLDEEGLEKSYSFSWEESDRINVKGNSLLLEDIDEMGESTQWPVQLLTLKPLFPQSRKQVTSIMTPLSGVGG